MNDVTTRQRGEQITLPDGLIVPRGLIDDLKATWDGPRNNAPVYRDRQYVPNETERCPNCNGPVGEGKLYSPTGKKRPRGTSLFGGDWIEREDQAYDCPVCSDGRIRMALIRRSGIGDWQDVESTLIWDRPERQHIMTAFNLALAHWSDQRRAFGWLNLIGGIGSGKTLLSQLAVCRLIQVGLTARYALAGDLSDLAFQALRDDVEPMVALRGWYDVPFLALDEVFLMRQRASNKEMNFGSAQVVHLLDYRYRNRKTLATIMVWDRAWWNWNSKVATPNITLAGDFGMILSRAQEAEWTGYTDCPDLRPLVGRRGQKEYGQFPTEDSDGF